VDGGAIVVGGVGVGAWVGDEDEVGVGGWGGDAVVLVFGAGGVDPEEAAMVMMEREGAGEVVAVVVEDVVDEEAAGEVHRG
jgi:hypothetical protein